MSKKETIIDINTARRVLEIVDQGLSTGLGEPTPGKMCVEAAVCYALGLPHNDEPPCVDRAVRAFKIKLNDSKWSSNQARAKGMRELAVAQLGTNDPSFDRKKFVEVLVEETIKQIVPVALRSVKRFVSADYKSQLEEAAVLCESMGTRNSAISARDLCRKIKDAAADAADAADAAADAAYAAAYAADAYAAADAAYAAAYAADAASRDKTLTIAANLGIKALKAAGAVGVKFLEELS